MPSRVMTIGIIGSGYVGTVTGAGLAELGNDVTFVDFDSDKVEALNRGKSPIFEPGLDELLAKNRGRYHATTDYDETLSFTERTCAKKDFFRASQRKGANTEVLVGVMLGVLAAMLRTACEGVGWRWVTRSFINCLPEVTRTVK